MTVTLIFTFIILLIWFSKILIKKGDEIIFGTLLIGTAILLIRLFAQSSYNYDKYVQSGNSLSLWLLEATNGVLSLPLFFLFPVLAIMLIKNIFLSVVNFSINVIYYILCYSLLIGILYYFFILTYNVTSRKSIFDLSFAYLFHYLISYIAIFFIEFVFKSDGRSFLNIEKEFSEMQEDRTKLVDFVDKLTTQISSPNKNNFDWKLYFTRGKAYYGLQKNNEAIADLKKSSEIILSKYGIKWYLFNSQEFNKIDAEYHSYLEKTFLTLSLAYYKQADKSYSESYLYKYYIVCNDKSKFLDYSTRIKKSSGVNLKSFNFEYNQSYKLFKIPTYFFLFIIFCVFFVGTTPEIVAREIDRDDIIKDRIWTYRLDFEGNTYVGEYLLKSNSEIVKTIIQIKSPTYSSERIEKNEYYAPYQIFFSKIGETNYIAKGKYILKNGLWTESINEMFSTKNNIPVDLTNVSKLLKQYDNLPNEIINSNIIHYNHNVIEVFVETDKKWYRLKMKRPATFGTAIKGYKWYEVLFEKVKKWFGI